MGELTPSREDNPDEKCVGISLEVDRLEAKGDPSTTSIQKSTARGGDGKTAKASVPDRNTERKCGGATTTGSNDRMKGSGKNTRRINQMVTEDVDSSSAHSRRKGQGKEAGLTPKNKEQEPPRPPRAPTEGTFVPEISRSIDEGRPDPKTLKDHFDSNFASKGSEDEGERVILR